MKKQIPIEKKYLLIPVCAEKEIKPVSFFCQNEKIYEFAIPVNDEEEAFYGFHYMASLNVEKYIGKKLVVEGDLPSSFMDAIAQSDSRPEITQSHPKIHFTPNTGWLNDPNGLIYQNGEYHLFYQYNPFNTQWENMSWGHAVSKDLIHWESREVGLYPDGEGTMYSGSGIVNEKGLLGLPEDAQIYFYTCAGGKNVWSAGKTFTQKIAYSTDGGKTLQKMEGCVLRHIVAENRDPKVYWHEESKAYYMALYLDQNDFAIFRSKDLKNWKKSQSLTLEGAWECPDLRKIPVEGGGEKWMFWSADGFYFLGDFDGFEFKTDGEKHFGYKTSLPYAAQTYWGTEDVITVPWLRTKNKGKLYTGGMGIPRKLTLAQTENGLSLRQVPVDGYYANRTNVHSSEGDGKVFYMMQKEGALEVSIHMTDPGDFSLNLYGTPIIYVSSCGKLSVGKETIEMGNHLNDFSIIADGELLEVSAGNGLVLAVLELESDKKEGTVTVETAGEARVELFRVE